MYSYTIYPLLSSSGSVGKGKWFHGIHKTQVQWISIFSNNNNNKNKKRTLYNTPFSSDDAFISILVHLKVQLVANIEPTYSYLCLAIS